ncbi:DUF2617 family protein [Nocardiopsis algeriensis]|uniref:DUF2617 family protein n=1 Tax=Nocardiopsis algeriensis TaxID=1478215 RepID=A0A841IX39_9ACTN|nr:DUF2617 family protein [Nocardiopsis algeriensis]MBB6121055.1 hypothetical protein [Nocardiopsis algeriensis]
MLTSISAPFVDTSASDLVWTLGHPLVEPLAVRTVRHAGARIELRVLGASHQVLVQAPGGELLETVACLPGVEGGLPGGAERPLPGAGSYRFSSEVEHLSRAELARRVERIRREADDRPHALLASFPGDELAVTGLHLLPGRGSLRWRTWHAYPQSGELVTTASTVTAPPTSERTAP